MRILVTGGCGFIGSNFVRHVLAVRPEASVLVLDALTYAGNLENLCDLLDSPRLQVRRGDIADREAVLETATGVDAIVNFAAESHVDRSIQDAAPFVRTNIVGTQVLLSAAHELRVPRFLQISTDEVYGSLGPGEWFTESTPLAANSPYSASKAAADLLVRAYVHTHGLPALTVRSSNAYGPYQFPEKLIPLMLSNAMVDEPLPVYGDGIQERDWVHVSDLCDAILQILEHGRTGEVYNVGGGRPLPNQQVVRILLRLLGKPESLIRFVRDRPGHDRRYAMDHSKLTAELGWRPTRDFESGLAETVAWYLSHPEWVQSVRSREYQRYYASQYSDRLAATPPARVPLETV